jgi:hypothetical protein
MSDSLPKILLALGLTEGQTRDHTITWEQVLTLAALVDEETADDRLRISTLVSEVKRLSGCLLAIAGGEGRDTTALRTAAYQAATTLVSVEAIASRLGVPSPWISKPPPVTAKDVTDDEVEAAWMASGWEPANPLPELGRETMRHVIAHVKNQDRGHG